MPRLFAIFRRQPPWAIMLGSLALVALLGWADYTTGWEWSFFVLYAVPIVLVVWKTDRQVGFAFASLCAAAWWASQFHLHPYQTKTGFALAALGRLFYFAVVAVAAGAVKAQREFDRSRIETLELMQKLEGDVLGTCEREQQRIGRDLHDNLGPHLAAIGYAATFLANELRARGQPEAAKAEKIRDLVGDAVSLTRDLAREIVPVLLDGSGLSIALEDLARTISGHSGLAVSFHETGDTTVENSDDSLHIYRVAQEAVNNAVKHGGARKITILLSKGDASLRLAVADDGQGMTSRPADARGMGIHSMRYRARILQSELKIDSRPDEGTVVSCEIPNRPPHSAAT